MPALSRRSRLLHLRKLASLALDNFGLTGARLRFLQFGENCTYRVDAPALITTTPSLCLPGRYLLRIHAISDVAMVSSELDWLEALNHEAGIPAPLPASAKDGKLIQTIIAPGFPNGRVVSLLHWVDGHKIRQRWGPRHLEALGEAVARLHAFAATWLPPKKFTRYTWDWDSLLGGNLFDDDRDVLVKSMPKPYQMPFEKISEQAHQAMDNLGKDSKAFGLIHADLYPENVLFKGSRAYPIDFEDCGFGYWIWDIAVALCTWAWDSDWIVLKNAFQTGYSHYWELPEGQWALLDLFIAIQFATMTLWASAFLKNDPVRVAEYEPWRNRNGEKLLEFAQGGSRVRSRPPGKGA